MAPSSAASIPALPPSVEEAYRRKCIQLKQRTAEVEEANEASRLRLARLNRQAEKMRIERAFLLEQLAKRTSTNVEDSDGSPSPPPTPKEKPLRTKRGHRKMSLNPGLDASGAPGSTFISQTTGGPSGGSPVSDVFSHTNADSQSQRDAAGASSSRANGQPPQKPSTAFELYCRDLRPSLEAKVKDEGKRQPSENDEAKEKGKDKEDDAEMDVESNDKDDDKAKGAPASSLDEELERGWKDLPEAERKEFEDRHEKELAKYKKEKEAYDKKRKSKASAADDDDDDDAARAERATSSAVPTVKVERPADEPGSQAADTPQPAMQDEDVEMTNYDTEPEAGATPRGGGGDKD